MRNLSTNVNTRGVHLRVWRPVLENPFSSSETAFHLVSSNLDLLELWELDKLLPMKSNRSDWLTIQNKHSKGPLELGLV